MFEDFCFALNHMETPDNNKKPIRFTKRELARALRNILSFRAKPKQLDKSESIEEKVSDKAIIESRIRVIEQSDFWKEHAKSHEGAKLVPLNVDVQSPQSIRESLGLEDVDYKLHENVEFIGYANKTNPTPSGSYSSEQLSNAPIGGGGAYIAATSDPKNKHFWMGCTCGVTMKAEEDFSNQGLHISTYDVGNINSNS